MPLNISWINKWIHVWIHANSYCDAYLSRLCREQGWVCCHNSVQQAKLQKVPIFGWLDARADKIKCGGQERKAGITADLQGTLNPRVWFRCNHTCIEPLQIIDDLLWAFVSSFKTWGIIISFPLQFWNSNLLGRFSDLEILLETNHGKTFCLESWKQFLKYEVQFWFNEMLLGCVWGGVTSCQIQAS